MSKFARDPFGWRTTMTGSRVAIAQKTGNERQIAATHPRRYITRRPMRSERFPNRGIVTSSTPAPRYGSKHQTARESLRMIRRTALSSFGLPCFLANLHRPRSAFRGGAFHFSERLSRRVHPTKGSCSWPRTAHDGGEPARPHLRPRGPRARPRPLFQTWGGIPT
jgi:hypothetical protein